MNDIFYSNSLYLHVWLTPILYSDFMLCYKLNISTQIVTTEQKLLSYITLSTNTSIQNKILTSDLKPQNYSGRT